MGILGSNACQEAGPAERSPPCGRTRLLPSPPRFRSASKMDLNVATLCDQVFGSSIGVDRHGRGGAGPSRRSLPTNGQPATANGAGMGPWNRRCGGSAGVHCPGDQACQSAPALTWSYRKLKPRRDLGIDNAGARSLHRFAPPN